MRKLIVKYFALDYICRVFGKSVNFVRAANVIFPLMCLSGILMMANAGIIFTMSLILTLLSLFLGFVYFRISPIKWEELDKNQKWQFGKFHIYQSLDFDHKKEWETINKEILETENNKFYNIKPLMVNLVVFILMILSMFI